MNSKNIWIINHYAFPYGYGFHTRAHTIAKILKDIGYEVTIFASSFNHLKVKEVEVENIYKEEFHDDIKYIWIKTKKYQGNGFGRISNSFEFSKNLDNIYKSFTDKPDIIWASSPQPFIIYNALKMKKYFKCKFIYEERDIWPLTLQILNGVSKYNPISLIFRYLQIKAYKKSDLIITPLDNLSEYVQKSGIKNKQVEVIPQPFVSFNTKEFDLNIPKNKFLVGYIGSIGHSNSVFNLVKAANLLKNNNDIHFIMVGDGPQLEELKQYTDKYHLNNITFKGKLTKDKAMYVVSRCDILYKGHPDIELYKYGLSAIKLAEYMSSGKPIIHAVKIKNDPVLLSNSGLVIESDNEDELKKSILKLQNDHILYNKLSNNGKKFVQDNFTEIKIEEKLKKIMDRI